MIDVKKILSEMTFEEKCTILTGDHALGTAAMEQYDITDIKFSDGPHGIRRLLNPGPYQQKQYIDGGDTAMPTASAAGASWNVDAVYEAGETIAKDCIEEDVQMLLAPGVNMKRTPHCGRNFEYFSEDPYLSGMLGAAFINGVQSKGVGTSLKHYAANNQEILRGSINAEIDEKTLRDYYLKVFEIVLKHSNPTSVMCSYNKLNGIWASENRYLLTELLKEEWGYDGLVVSDWGAVHDMAKCIKAGLDLQMPKNCNIKEDIQKGLDRGIITQQDLDRAVEAMLNFINRIIEMSEPNEDYDRAQQHEAAYRAACESITLLRNNNDILPITKEKYKKIAVLGEPAKMPLFMGGGSSRVTVGEENVDIPFDCILKNADGIEVDYVEISDSKFKDEKVMICVDRIKDSYDAVILFAADNYGADCETESFDRDNIKLPNYMNAVISGFANKAKNFILVTQFGGAVLPYTWENVPAMVQMWYTGEASGRAIADILFGKVNPSGKLSETFMIKDRTDLDYPGDGVKLKYTEMQNVGYRYYDKHPEEIFFPFGHGLSYTTFEYSDIKVDRKIITDDKFELNVSCKIKNTGAVTGKEVVQLYIAPLDSITERPIKELRGFKKPELAPGEIKEISFKLTDEDFAYYNTCLHGYHVESGMYDILIAASSRDIRLSEGIEIGYYGDYTKEKSDGSMIPV